MESLQNLQTSISAVPPQLRHIGQHALPKLHVAVVGRLARVVPLEHREQLCVLILLKEYGERYIYILPMNYLNINGSLYNLVGVSNIFSIIYGIIIPIDELIFFRGVG